MDRKRALENAGTLFGPDIAADAHERDPSWIQYTCCLFVIYGVVSNFLVATSILVHSPPTHRIPKMLSQQFVDPSSSSIVRRQGAQSRSQHIEWNHQSGTVQCARHNVTSIPVDLLCSTTETFLPQAHTSRGRTKLSLSSESLYFMS